VGALGQKLKSEREKRKISLEEVAVATKIGTRMLQALEDEKFDRLPGGIFNKNFVRNYAHFLGLNEQEAVADYMAAAGPAPEPLPEDQELRAIAERKEKESHRPRSAGVPWGIVAVFLLLIALGLSVWGFYSRERVHTRSELLSANTIATSSPLPQAPKSIEQSMPVSANPAPLAAAPVVMNAAITERAPDVNVVGAYPGGSSSGTEAEAVSSTANSNTTGQSFSVSVTARDNSWLTLTVDGNVIHHGMFSAPSEKTVDAQKEVIIKAGNIGGLEISFNGKKIRQQGGEGEVRILTFHANGLEPQ